jgi:hypothetical protein
MLTCASPGSQVCQDRQRLSLPVNEKKSGLSMHIAPSGPTASTLRVWCHPCRYSRNCIPLSIWRQRNTPTTQACPDNPPPQTPWGQSASLQLAAPSARGVSFLFAAPCAFFLSSLPDSIFSRTPPRLRISRITTYPR